jgi:hypothetical protein
LKDADVRLLLLNTSNLKQLNLLKCLHTRPSTIETVLENNATLEKLVLSSVQVCSTMMLDTIARCNHELVSLSLISCSIVNV